MTKFLVDAVQSYGILAVFILMTAESCGIPFPSEVVMPVAGALSAAGHMNAAAAVLAGAVGNLAGSAAAYGVAARWGEPVLLGPGRRVGISPHHVKLADDWFARYGLVSVFLGRLLPVVRTYISFPAGLARVRPVPFAVLTFTGALPWCALLTGAGFALGANYDRVSGPIGKIALVIAAAVVIVLVVWLVRGRQKQLARVG